MKKLTVISMCSLLVFFIWPQQDQENPVRENIAVINIEVPVRVFSKGKQVNDLKKEDFILFEGNEQQDINGFYIIRNKIKQNEKDSLNTVNASETSRYFVLIFQITEFNQELRTGITYIFQNVLKKNDQLMVFANNKTLFFNSLDNKENILKKMNNTLRKEAQKAHVQVSGTLKKMERDTYYAAQNWLDYPESIFSAMDYLYLQKRIWANYKRNYLMPDLNKYFNFSLHLENIKSEKWVINFYQMQMFPKLKRHGRMKRELRSFADSMMGLNGEWGRLIHKIMDELDMEMKIAKDFPIDEISKLFYKVNTTFHSIFIKSNIAGFSQDFEFKQASTDIENSLREITKKTGGSLISSNNIQEALEEIEEKENICYMLTYAPRDPEKKDKIRISIKDRNYKVIYDDNIRADYIAQYISKVKDQTGAVKLDQARMEEKNLFLKISNFTQKPLKKRSEGKLNVRIRVVESGKNKTIYDQNKTLVSSKQSITVTVPFSWLKKGNYNVVVDVVDLFSGRKEFRLIQYRI